MIALAAFVGFVAGLVVGAVLVALGIHQERRRLEPVTLAYMQSTAALKETLDSAEWHAVLTEIAELPPTASGPMH